MKKLSLFLLLSIFFAGSALQGMQARHYGRNQPNSTSTRNRQRTTASAPDTNTIAGGLRSFISGPLAWLQGESTEIRNLKQDLSGVGTVVGEAVDEVFDTIGEVTTVDNRQQNASPRRGRITPQNNEGFLRSWTKSAAIGLTFVALAGCYFFKDELTTGATEMRTQATNWFFGTVTSTLWDGFKNRVASLFNFGASTPETESESS